MYVLVGNGVNLNGKNWYDFSNERIVSRFADSLQRHKSILEGLFNVNICNIGDLAKTENGDGIEHIFGRLYNEIKMQYLSKTHAEELPVAVHQCMLDMITIIGIDAIYFTNNKINYPDIPYTIIDKLKKANKVFTLNYFENWDNLNNCVYLHGKYEPNLINANGTLLCDKWRYLNCPEYSQLIEYGHIRSEINNVHELTMAPVNLDKHDIKVIYPSDYTYPSDDLFPGDYNYNELEQYITIINSSGDSLHVFGMSPYGDKGLIERIGYIENIVIYVFKRAQNAKLENDWSRLLPKAVFKDSTDFYRDKKVSE